MAEAELELRSWYESHPTGKKAAFQPDGQGTGVRASRPSFPAAQASDLLKLKCVEFSVSTIIIFALFIAELSANPRRP